MILSRQVVRLVMARTEDGKVIEVVGPTLRARLDMVNVQAFRTALAVLIDVRALAVVAEVYRPFDGDAAASRAQARFFERVVLF